MHILISGASGLVGSAVAADLSAAGHSVSRLIRGSAGDQQATFRWQPEQGELSTLAIERADAVIHLAGESIATGRWTAAKKRRIRASRVDGTRLIAERIAAADPRPTVLLCASAVGYYGSRGADELTESAANGSGFLAGVCRDWEAATAPAQAAGVRTVSLRFGVVLNRMGGALAQLTRIFRWGAGATLGNGRQYMSWIALTDAVAAIRFALDRAQLSGPLNLVSPQPVTNAAFSHALGRALKRPVWPGIPALLLQLGLGEMATEMLLSSTRALPAGLLGAGFDFCYPGLDHALAAELAR